MEVEKRKKVMKRVVFLGKDRLTCPVHVHIILLLLSSLAMAHSSIQITSTTHFAALLFSSRGAAGGRSFHPTTLQTSAQDLLLPLRKKQTGKASKDKREHLGAVERQCYLPPDAKRAVRRSCVLFAYLT